MFDIIEGRGLSVRIVGLLPGDMVFTPSFLKINLFGCYGISLSLQDSCWGIDSRKELGKLFSFFMTPR
jgi:hypothetical protein